MMLGQHTDTATNLDFARSRFLGMTNALRQMSNDPLAAAFGLGSVIEAWRGYKYQEETANILNYDIENEGLFDSLGFSTFKNSEKPGI
jgi:hypothetical protein